MSKLKNALMENTEEDMALPGGLSSEAKLIRKLLDENGMTVSEAWIVGYTLHDIDTNINRLNTVRPENLKAVIDDVTSLIAKLTQLAAKASE